MRLRVEPPENMFITYSLEVAMVDVARAGISPRDMPTPGRAVSVVLRELADMAEEIESATERHRCQTLQNAFTPTPCPDYLEAEIVEPPRPQIPPKGYEHILIYRGNLPAIHGATHEEDRSPE